MEEREKIALRLREAGVDVDGAVARFMGNWSLFYRFLRKFPEEWNPAQVRALLEQKDEEGFHRALHTVKGMAGNLGAASVFQATEETLAELRANGLADCGRLSALWARAEAAGETLLAALEELPPA